MPSRPVLSDSESDHDVHLSTQAGPSRHRPRHSEQSQGGRKKLELSDVFTRQDRETKARLGRDYREMQVRAEDLKTNVANASLADIRKSMRTQDRLFKEVKDTSLAALDARLMHTTADTALDIARKMKIEGNVFDVDEFLLRVGSLLGLDRPELDDQDPDSDEDELEESMSDRGRRRAPTRRGHLGDWEKLGWMAAKLNRRVTGVEFLYGPLKVKPRAPIQRTVRKKVVEPETRPQEISTQPQASAAADEKDTVALVKQVGDVLERSDPDGRGINFFRLVIDPDDFGQSVENCFYVSFLIKEGKAGIDVMDDGEVMIYAKDGNDMDVDGGDVTRHQAVIELDMDTWEEAKELFHITSSTIPHRHYTKTGPLAANTWYA